MQEEKCPSGSLSDEDSATGESTPPDIQFHWWKYE